MPGTTKSNYFSPQFQPQFRKTYHRYRNTNPIVQLQDFVQLKKHMSNVYPSRKPTTCPICKKSIAQARYLHKHLEICKRRNKKFTY